ncbi:MAG: Gfo/Idh/MocA family oxidoreductase [Saprospiraceae bacterium]|nr:Gfo/Idh/MocA family oxidoreductase [Saprospiraceae bacterium]
MKGIAMLGSGFISDFYANAILSKRHPESIAVVQSRTLEKAQAFAKKFGISVATDSIHEAVSNENIDVVIIGLPNHQHEEAVQAAAEAGKAVLCTKPLGRNAEEALRMLKIVEEAGVFHGYLEDLVYTPKALKTVETIKAGAMGRILWTRSRETHPGPHSDWFWNKELAGGGAIVDLACHCIELGRNYIGKDEKPLEVFCWAETQVKPIDAEDHAIGLIKYGSGAISQFEVSWAFRGGLDLRDEVMGTEGTVWINHFLRTGFEMFTAPGSSGYVAEKAESDSGWIFPVGDELQELGYNHMFVDMFNAIDNGTTPLETFYDGYIVNAIMDAAYLSAESGRWEPVKLDVWRGKQPGEGKAGKQIDYDEHHILIKEELLPNGVKKVILKEKATGRILQKTI